MTTSEADRDEPSEIGSAGKQSVVVDDGRTICYAEYGDPAGTPVVFLHGTPGSRVLGQLFDERAREYGIRLLAPDRPGYGRSSPQPGRVPAETTDDITTVMDDADVERASIVGFSSGARYAFALAAMNADRVADIHLVSGATPSSLQDEIPPIQRLLGTLARTTPRLLRALFRGQQWVAKRASPDVVLSQYTTDDAAPIPNDVAEVVRRDFVEAFVTSQSGAVSECRLFAGEWNVRCEEVEHTVRLWHGQRDTNVPVDAVRRVCEQLPNGQLTVLENQDHLGTLVRTRESILQSIT